jgi:CRP/FNR family transcriptional regulator, cyclic AMP receptor protein
MRAALDLIGYLASALVLATFTTNEMRLLRIIGIFSNLAFITYGGLGELFPVVVLHLLLLPLNVVRLLQLAGSSHARGLAPVTAR